MKRVFTKTLGIPTVKITAALNEYPFAVVAEWRPQEDIVVVGALISLFMWGIGNDGAADMRCEITQSGMEQADGMILTAGVVVDWNTSPAFGRVYNYGEKNIMLPSGYGIPVSEGTPINATYHGTNSSAADVDVGGVACVYYVKGKTVK